MYRETSEKYWEIIKQLPGRISSDGVQFTIESPGELLSANNSENNRFKTEVITNFESGVSKNYGLFIVNKRPRKKDNTSGCSISPSSGIGVSTIFNITCKGWYDEDLPLTYQFVYHEVFGTVIFHYGHERSKSTTLPPGKEENDFDLQLEASVIDCFGSETKLILIVKVIVACVTSGHSSVKSRNVQVVTQAR